VPPIAVCVVFFKKNEEGFPSEMVYVGIQKTQIKRSHFLYCGRTVSGRAILTNCASNWVDISDGTSITELNTLSG